MEVKKTEAEIPLAKKNFFSRGKGSKFLKTAFRESKGAMTIILAFFAKSVHIMLVLPQAAWLSTFCERKSVVLHFLEVPN